MPQNVFFGLLRGICLGVQIFEAFGKLLSKGMAALEAMRQKKACLMQSKKKNEGERLGSSDVVKRFSVAREMIL